MTLIFAFRDESGRWHGDPDARPEKPAAPGIGTRTGTRTGFGTSADPRTDSSGTGTLTYTPHPASPASANPFAGQRLEVRFADVGVPPSTTAYTLDDGRVLHATQGVRALLGDPDEIPGPHPGPDRVPTPAGPRVTLGLEEDSRRYEIALATTVDDRLALEITASDADGEILTRLEGVVAREDLTRLGRLLTRTPALAKDLLKPARPARSAKPASDRVEDERRHHPNAYKPWTDADDARLTELAKGGATTAELCAAFGRNSGAIRSRLMKLGLFPE